jgi:hypothetical protein
MMTDLDCREEEHELICWQRDVEQGIIGGTILDDIHGTSRPADEAWEDEE